MTKTNLPCPVTADNSATPTGGTLKRNESAPTIPYSGSGDTTPTNGLGAVDDHHHQQLYGNDGPAWDYVPLHERISKRIRDRIPFFSLEFFPPKTANGVANFFTRLDRFREGGPMFVDVTWHLGSDPANINKETSSSSIAAGCQNYCLVDTMLHMTCAQYTKQQTLNHLEKCKSIGLRNVLALRGDCLKQGSNPVIYQYHALDMIRWIKEEYGDYFTIACSGYPLGHPEATSYSDDLRYLKCKVDAGAQIIITQLFFEAEAFEQFVRDCREIGITVPIIPGVMPIMGYESIRRIADLSQLTIPTWLLDELEPIKHDDDAVMKYGKHLAVQMCKRLLNNGTAPSIHLYTMNREASCREILTELGLWNKCPIRALPWKSGGDQHPLRCKEDVRPIFWCARPKSYIFRTRDWDAFPNGRWGNSSSPAFGDLQEYYLFYLKGQSTHDELLRMYGNRLESEKDVSRVFVNFIKQEMNENGVKVTRLPWSETAENATQAETSIIRDQLVWCNENGILTINSQPPVNGAPSTDPLVGWGKPGGYCYQKAYLEFFVSLRHAEILHCILPNYPRINYHIINHDASIDWTNTESTLPIAVTWGVFPGAEIAQPTVVDPLSFRVWKDEAYDAWINVWGVIYPDDSPSRQLLHRIHDSYCLVTLVDNDFPQPCIIYDVLNEMIAKAEIEP